MHHYITKYKENGKAFAESWLQINIFGRCFCFSKRKIVLETDEESPVTIAEITSEKINAADGYKVRLTPKYDDDKQPSMLFTPKDSSGTKYSPQSISIPCPLNSHGEYQ